MNPRKTRAKAPEPRPRQIGDYFVCKYGSAAYVHQKTGPNFMDDVHVATAATTDGAEKLAALMNAARELAMRPGDIALSSPYKSQSTRDWAAHCVAAAICEALDTPLPYFDPREEARESILYFEHNGQLAELFRVLDAAGTPETLKDQPARFALLKHSGRGRRHYTEVIRAWRQSFDKSIPAEERARTVVASARAENRGLAA